MESYKSRDLGYLCLSQWPLLCDLTMRTEEELRKFFGEAELLSQLLQQAPQGKFLVWIKRNSHLVKKLLSKRYRSLGVRYMLEHERGNSPEELMEAVRRTRQSRRQGGRAGNARSLEIARSMLHNLNLGVDAIHQATGLSKAEISRL